jgi:hypothetical protein
VLCAPDQQSPAPFMPALHRARLDGRIIVAPKNVRGFAVCEGISLNVGSWSESRRGVDRAKDALLTRAFLGGSFFGGTLQLNESV